jgi:hypothetical protein
MRTTDVILAELHKLAEDGEDVRQRVIAHETLSRLRAERGDAVKRKDAGRIRDLDVQIRQWLTMVNTDVDERVVADPAKDSAKLVAGYRGPDIEDLPTGGPALTGPAQP